MCVSIYLSVYLYIFFAKLQLGYTCVTQMETGHRYQLQPRVSKLYKSER